VFSSGYQKQVLLLFYLLSRRNLLLVAKEKAQVLLGCPKSMITKSSVSRTCLSADHIQIARRRGCQKLMRREGIDPLLAPRLVANAELHHDKGGCSLLLHRQGT